MQLSQATELDSENGSLPGLGRFTFTATCQLQTVGSIFCIGSGRRRLCIGLDCSSQAFCAVQGIVPDRAWTGSMDTDLAILHDFPCRQPELFCPSCCTG